MPPNRGPPGPERRPDRPGSRPGWPESGCLEPEGGWGWPGPAGIEKRVFVPGMSLKPEARVERLG